jgi:hypothetical protein
MLSLNELSEIVTSSVKKRIAEMGLPPNPYD